MTYDHHQKAGNQGDMVKHVALLTVLDCLLKTRQQSVFCYADVFAGYASNILSQGGEWRRGIEGIVARDRSADRGHVSLTNNPHTRLWWTWYLAAHAQLEGQSYPGSSLLATHVCRAHNVTPHLRLWDISESVITNLQATYRKSCHQIFDRPAEPGEDAVRSADFVFVDPPGLRSPHQRTYPDWCMLQDYLTKRRAGQVVLMWLPVSAVTSPNVEGRMVPLTPPGEDAASQIARAFANERGFSTLRVRWGAGRPTIGCVLIAAGLEPEVWTLVREAVDCLVAVAGWRLNDSANLRVID